MSDKKKTPSVVDSGTGAAKGLFQTYRSEFRKIVWPSRETLIKHTVTVIAVSLIFGAYIALMDGIFGAIFRAFVDFVL